MKKGVILNNIGSPNAADTQSVRIYLREFLMDPGVISLPFILRFILVYLIITPFRAPKSAAKYQKIWTDLGSPLVSITKAIAKKMESLNSDLLVETGMLFQNPSLKSSILQLVSREPALKKIYFIPMYPQYSAATTEASMVKLKSVWKKESKSFPNIKEFLVLKPFYNNEKFIDNCVEKMTKFYLASYDQIVFSYHGLPESAILKNSHCNLGQACCETGMKKNCYRSQCFETTRLILRKLNTVIPSVTTFQSRLGRGAWIKPYTDETLKKLAEARKKRILIVCPAFTVDCLETLEEIQIENRQIFIKAGGEAFDYVPCLNDDSRWCQDLAAMMDNPHLFDRL